MGRITRRHLAIALSVSLVTAFVLVAVAPLHAGRTDNRIEKTARKSYVFKTYLKHDHIKVESEEGVVTLTGTVTEESHKAMAEETVMSLPGVKRVDNQLTIETKPASPLSDEWLSERIRGTLLLRRSVSYVDTDVSVKDGKVTLRGKASSKAQKQLTSEYVKDVSGVKTVDNQMIVKTSPPKSFRSRGQKIDDASITSQVRMSLVYYHGTDPFDTKVSTNKGVVTLTGTAKDQAEIDLMTKRVADINGVETVDNKMTIAAVQPSIE